MRISDWSSDVCSSDLSRLYHDGKVRRKCALRQARSLDELAGRKPVGFMLNQQAEGFEPGGMCQRSERRQRGFSIHASDLRSEEHTSELQSLMRISYAVFCLKKKNEKRVPKKCKT